MTRTSKYDKPIILTAGQGRTYHCGPMTAIFKADEDETDNKYSISEWWLEPNSEGPAPHQHDDQEQIFYILQGTISVLVGDKRIEAERGTFIRIPRSTMHTFANRTDTKAGMLNVDIPGGFERNLPSMVEWFEENKQQ